MLLFLSEAWCVITFLSDHLRFHPVSNKIERGNPIDLLKRSKIWGSQSCSQRATLQSIFTNKPTWKFQVTLKTLISSFSLLESHGESKSKVLQKTLLDVLSNPKDSDYLVQACLIRVQIGPLRAGFWTRSVSSDQNIIDNAIQTAQGMSSPGIGRGK